MNRAQSAIRAFAAALTAALLLSACATMGGGTPEEQVADRAQARWDLLLERNLEDAYEYFTPGYRSSVSIDQWRRKLSAQPVTWDGASVTGVTCDPEGSCMARVRVDYSIRGGLPGVQQFKSVTDVEETWINSNGEWFYLPKS
ncbi:hypothetical protein F3N42_10345 [Marinihelvus fidelis]|uniref:Nuclear transport factor 2 family protein n=1 Tax=Marinihelvus fidelis TaxID=2613842 RepID=A0A5N0T6T8_9GAMM|nr:hypothetical protein [Marinihelvus fidelis]KAA9130765.1 hypothetical protein F3N42_10345 [Marinihelvus fidelis]